MKHRPSLPPFLAAWLTVPRFLWPWLMSFLLSFGATAILITAFDLDTLSVGRLLWTSLLFSGVCSLVMTYAPRKWTPAALGIGAVLLLHLLAGIGGFSLLSSLEALLYQISHIFDRTYHWGVIRWNDTRPSADPGAALLLISCLLSLTVSVTVCRRKQAAGAVFLALIPLLLCMVARDTVPDPWCLWLLLIGLGLLVLTGSSRRMDAEAGKRLTAMVLIPTILATTVLFWILPPAQGETGGLSDRIVSWVQSLPFWPQSHLGSISFAGDTALAEVDLTRLGNRQDTANLAMTLVTSHSGQLYLRGRSYDRYDGKTWEATGSGSGEDRGWSSPRDEYLRSVTIFSKSPRQLLYFPGSPGVDLRGKAFEMGMLPNYDSQLEYTFNYGIPNKDASLDEALRAKLLELPAQTKNRLVTHLYSILEGTDPGDTASIARAIEAYVELSAEYSYSPSRMPADVSDFALWFLNEAEYGYCVHFATAATVLLRAAGIPARYVTGYCVDVLAGLETNVRERHAHAWAEYFHPELGWMILDPTPGSPGPDPLPSEPAPTDATEPQPSTEVTDPTEPSQGVTSPTDATGSTQNAATQRPTEPSQQAPGSAAPDWIKATIRWLLAIAAALVLLWGQYRLRIWARHRYLRRGSINRQALKRYRLIVFRSRLLKKPIPSRLTELAEKARFSQHRLTGAELLELDRHLKVLARKLAKHSRFLCFLLAIE